MRILIVDDEPDILDTLDLVWSEEDLELYLARNAEDALHKFQSLKPRVVVTDYRMPGMDGIELIRELRKVEPSIRTVLMTAFPDARLRDEAKAAGCDAFFTKPFDAAATLQKIRELGA